MNKSKIIDILVVNKMEGLGMSKNYTKMQLGIIENIKNWECSSVQKI